MGRTPSKIRISIQELIEITNQLNLPDGRQERSSGHVSREGPSPPWRGSVTVESFRPGFHIYIINLRAYVDLEISAEYTESAIGFGLALEGNFRQTMPSKLERISALRVTAGQNLAAVCRPERVNLFFPGGHQHRIVKLQINPEEMGALLEGHEGQIPEMLRPVIFPSKPWRAEVTQPLSPTLEHIAYQVINCPFKGAARRLFLEGKALEILAEELGGVREPVSAQTGSYSPEDYHSLERARTILQQEYSNPPTILALSRRIGLNDFKLKRGFKDFFGITIFGYVRKLRMEKARAMLESGRYNVTEAALETGHSCLGHFAAAFKREFGVVPSQYRAGTAPDRGRGTYRPEDIQA